MKEYRHILVGFASVHAMVFAMVITFGLFSSTGKAGCNVTTCLNCIKNAVTGLCDGDKRMELCMTNEEECSTCICKISSDGLGCSCRE